MDLDTTSTGNIFYRETYDSSILDQLKSYIVAYNSSTSSLTLRSAFIVTYDNVPFYRNSNQQRYNSFQIIITTSASCETFAVVIYNFLYFGRGTFSALDFSAGYSAKIGILYKQLAHYDLAYLTDNSRLMPCYVVYKLSNEPTCGNEINFFLFFLFVNSFFKRAIDSFANN